VFAGNDRDKELGLESEAPAIACTKDAAMGAAKAAPVPERLTLCGLPVALSVRVTAAVSVPLAAGVKVTLIVQLVPAATLDPQLLV
jgi:hypothetical protein